MSERGSAVVLTLILTTMLSAIGLGLITLAGTERAVAGNQQAGVQILYAAEALAERVLLDLSLTPHWSDVLTGNAPSSLVNGSTHPQTAWRETLDLPAMTQALQSETDAGSSWGLNTPAWRLFASGPLATLTGDPNSGAYLIAWIADDQSESDNDTAADANGVLILRVQALGPGLRRTLHIAIKQGGWAGSATGLSVLSWKEVR
jgi:hypothetical protein